jgi:hypothetical protein
MALALYTSGIVMPWGIVADGYDISLQFQRLVAGNAMIIWIGDYAGQAAISQPET